MVLDKTLENVHHLRGQLLEINRVLRRMIKHGKYAKGLQLLMGIPGIGFVSAVTLLSELESISRFGNLDRFCSYVGLVPSTCSSGENEVNRGITPRSNNHLRTVIIECAWIAIHQDPALALRFTELCQRMKKNDAIVRIAKKLLNRIRYVMKNEKEYVNAVA
jgi:transposase